MENYSEDSFEAPVAADLMKSAVIGAGIAIAAFGAVALVKYLRSVKESHELWDKERLS